VTACFTHPPDLRCYGEESSSGEGIFFLRETKRNDYLCSFFLHILLRNNVKSDVLFILEQYMVMSNRFILPIVMDLMRFGGQRIRAAQTPSPQRPPRHWFVYLARGSVWGHKEGWEGVISLQKQTNKNRNTCCRLLKYLELFVFICFLCLYNCMFMSLPNKRLTLVVWRHKSLNEYTHVHGFKL